MGVHCCGRRIGDDGDPATTAVRPASRAADAPGRPTSARAVVVAGEDRPNTRYAFWPADTYETRIVRCGGTTSIRPGTGVVVVDRRTLATAGGRVRGTADSRRSDCRGFTPATPRSCDDPVDGRLTEPVGRDGLLGRAGSAMRTATDHDVVAEPRSLTMRRRGLPRSDVASLPERIDERHRRVDGELSDVASRYAALLGRKHRPSTRRKPGDGSA